jgi:chitodextrinase
MYSSPGQGRRQVLARRLLPALMAATTALTSPAMACAPAYSPSQIYVGGMQASQNAIAYRANWWVQGVDPATNSGPWQPWTVIGSCSSCTVAPPVPQGLANTALTATSATISWGAVTLPNCTVTGYAIFQNGTQVATVPYPATSYTASGLSPQTGYVFAVAAIDAAGMSNTGTKLSVTTPAGTGDAGGTTGTIGFHLLLGAGSAQDSLTLDGDGYTDLIESNIIAGVMYAHLVGEGFPGVQFNRDYLVGSIMGQLLQENIATEYYVNPPSPLPGSASLIDPSADQQAVMGAGQGGPYQINNYAIDMLAGTYAPQGHSLVNYIAIQKNIGYSYASAGTQYAKTTPASFNDKYYGPMLPAFFHYNDMVTLYLTGKGAGGWQTPWEPQYDHALTNFEVLPDGFLDVILNAAYNQGYYGGLVASYSSLGATATAATVAQVNSYASVWGSQDTYQQYPYQVHYYLDQMYDNPVPTTSPTLPATPANHIVFTVAGLQNVFVNAFVQLAYSNGAAPAQFFTAVQAQTAFAAALTGNKVTAATLDLSNPADRAVIFAVIDSAIGTLETAVGMPFNATTLQQL